jgi:hypothetical protein
MLPEQVPGLRVREPDSYPIGAKPDAPAPAQSNRGFDPLRHNITMHREWRMATSKLKKKKTGWR